MSLGQKDLPVLVIALISTGHLMCCRFNIERLLIPLKVHLAWKSSVISRSVFSHFHWKTVKSSLLASRTVIRGWGRGAGEEQGQAFVPNLFALNFLAVPVREDAAVAPRGTRCLVAQDGEIRWVAHRCPLLAPGARPGGVGESPPAPRARGAGEGCGSGAGGGCRSRRARCPAPRLQEHELNLKQLRLRPPGCCVKHRPCKTHADFYRRANFSGQPVSRCVEVFLSRAGGRSALRVWGLF